MTKQPVSEKAIAKSHSNSAQAKRMSVSFSSDFVKLLEDLSHSQGISQNEVLRRAVATEAYIQREVGRGSTILIQKSNGDIREVVFR